MASKPKMAVKVFHLNWILTKSFLLILHNSGKKSSKSLSRIIFGKILGRISMCVGQDSYRIFDSIIESWTYTWAGHYIFQTEILIELRAAVAMIYWIAISHILEEYGWQDYKTNPKQYADITRCEIFTKFCANPHLFIA